MAGLIVAVVIGAVGVVPVAAEDPPDGTAVAPTATTEPAPADSATADSPEPAPADSATADSPEPAPADSAATDSPDPAPASADDGTLTGDAGPADVDGTTPTTSPDESSPATDATAPTAGDTSGTGDPTTATTGPAPAPETPSATDGAVGGNDADTVTTPGVVNDQVATVDARSTAVADTGHNVVADGTVQVIVVDQTALAPGGADSEPAAGSTAGGDASGATTSVGLALVVTGDASAVGGATDDSISQTALVKAVGAGEIEILQIALIVNLGVGVANTGGNSATGVDVDDVIGVSDATGAAAVATGDATALGNASDVQVVQAADVAAGSSSAASSQATDITSLGIAFANTGLNIVIGNTVVQLILVGQQPAGAGGGTAATSADPATGLAVVTTGSAGAIGNASATAIDQLATADAGDGGFVSILQRALVLNLGIALANSGMNTAVGNQGVDLADLRQESLAAALWTSLQSLFGGSGWLDPAGTAGIAADAVTAAGSDGTALVTTGDALAAGLASSTRVTQTAAGSAQAGGQAAVTQDATVTNAGLAVANTGGNAAAGLLALDAVVADRWADLGAYLAGFLGQLGTGAATAAPATSTWDLGDVLVDLFGEIHADELLIDGFAGLSDGQVEAAVARALGFVAGADGVTATGPGTTGPRIRVRQVTGTLTINLGIAASGGETARTADVDVIVLDQQSTAPSQAQVTRAVGQGVRAATQALAGGTTSGTAALDPEDLAVLVNATTGAAVVVTGDALAANATVVAVCQTYATPAAVCGPPAAPPAAPPVASPPAAPPATPGAAGSPGSATPAPATPVEAAAVRGTSPSDTAASSVDGLPRTGADPALLLRTAAGLLASGAVLVLSTRRRRTAEAMHARPAHLASRPGGRP